MPAEPRHCEHCLRSIPLCSRGCHERRRWLRFAFQAGLILLTLGRREGQQRPVARRRIESRPGPRPWERSRHGRRRERPRWRRQPERSRHAVLQLLELAARGHAPAGHLGALAGQEVLMIQGQPLGPGDRLQVLRRLALVAALADGGEALGIIRIRILVPGRRGAGGDRRRRSRGSSACRNRHRRRSGAAGSRL